MNARESTSTPIAIWRSTPRRQDALVLPVHSSRSARLGCQPANRSSGCEMEGAGSQVAAPRQSQWISLRPRPDHRQASHGTRMVDSLNWATGIDPVDWTPNLLPQQTTEAGVVTCRVRGATNWYSTAYSPATNLYYVMTVEDCTSMQGQRWWLSPYLDPAIQRRRSFAHSISKQVK